MTEYGYFKNGNWWKISYANGTHAVLIGDKEQKLSERTNFIGSYHECREFIKRIAREMEK